MIGSTANIFRDFQEQEQYVWVDTPEGGETRLLPFVDACRKEYYPVQETLSDYGYFTLIGWVPIDWWLEIGQHYVNTHPTAVFDANVRGNEEGAIERFVLDAEYWYEGVAG